MTIELNNHAHLFLLASAFLIWAILVAYVTDKQAKCEDTILEFPAVVLALISVAVIAGALIGLIIKSL